MKKFIFVFSLLFFGFLFFNVSSAQAATLYYNPGASDWNILANWWQDSGYTIPAASLPTVSDDVIITGDVLSNTGPAASVNTMIANDAYIAIDITVANGATFNASSYNLGSGTIFGNATFNNSTVNQGIITGDATFNDTTLNFGTVTGSAIFNNTSYSQGTVTGNATFNDESTNSNTGIVSGDAVFNDLSYNWGTVSGNAIFNYASGGTITLAGSQIWGTVSGTVKGSDDILITEFIFNDSSYNSSTISGNVTFNDTSYNNGDITGNVTFNNTSYNNEAVIGDAIFNDSSQNNNHNSVTGNVIFNSTSSNAGDVIGSATFNDSSFNNGGTVTVDAVFNDLSSNHNRPNFPGTPTIGTVIGNASFYDSTINQGDIGGDACFALTATNSGTVGGSTTVCSATLPIVTTSTSTLTINSSASVLQGSITDTGGESAGTVGFDYGLTASRGTIASKTGAFVREPFSVVVASLTCDTTYHYRAFATNSAGTGYGSDATFTTGSCSSAQVLYGIDSAAGSSDNLYTLNPATGAVISTIGSVGDYITGLAFNPITGILYGSSSNNAGDPKSLFTINTTTGVGTYLGTIKDAGDTARVMPDLAFRSDGRLYGVSSDGNLYTIDLTSCDGTDVSCLATMVGTSGISGTWGNGLAFDSNDNLYFFGNGDNSYYQIDPDTGLVITENTFINPSTNNYGLGAVKFNKYDTLFAARTNSGSSPADLIIIDTTTNTIISTGEDNADMIYISAIAFSIAAPAVTTSSASSITKTEVTSNGDITDTGGVDVTERGFEYGLTDAYGTTITESSGPYTTGTFTADITSLRCSTTYHYRAYATNIAGTSYGEDVTFDASNCPSSSGGRISPPPTIIPTETSSTIVSLVSSTVPVPPCSITGTLIFGSTGKEVKCLQQGLNARLNTNLAVDGIFGNKTKVAVIKFQLANGLKGDGIFGIKSRAVWKRK